MSRFAIDLTEMSDVRPLVPANDYPMRIVKAEVKTGTAKDSDRRWASVNLTLAVKDDDVAKLIGQDEPKVFASFYVNFDDEYKLAMNNNPELGTLLGICDLKTAEASERFAEGIDDDLDNFDWTAKYVGNMVEAFVGYDVLGKVTHRPKSKGSDEMVANVTKFAKLDD